ncbi:hypothetical protein KY308_03485 [Candidatus Woesearchaeota archaeon]|nr:hypothetical protein [Candidatus Woesearchaeota archaeon]
MNKRGDSQIDWVISLGIFLLYLAWFFIFIRPYTIQESTPNLVDVVKQNFENEAYWTVEKIPITITSMGYFQKEPVVTDISVEYSESNSHIDNRAFIISNGKIFFIANLNLSDTFYLIHSNETYQMYNQITDLTATEQSVTVTDFSAEFENSTLGSAFYFGTKIKSFLTKIEGQTLNTSNSSFSSKKIAAEYGIETEALNLTTYVFAYNPRIYMFYSTNKSIYQKFEIDNYQGYFFDNSDNGDIHYPTACYSKNSTQLLFYDNTSNVLFLFNKEVSFEFCSENTTVVLEINFKDSVLEKIIFFTGAKEDYTKYVNSYDAQMGIKEELTAPYLANIQRLEAMKYQDLKNWWSAPDFRIFVTNFSNNEIISTIGSEPYEKATVYAEETRNFLLDKYGNLEDIKISYQSWT